jgi:hypothetical protein
MSNQSMHCEILTLKHIYTGLFTRGVFLNFFMPQPIIHYYIITLLLLHYYITHYPHDVRNYYYYYYSMPIRALEMCVTFPMQHMVDQFHQSEQFLTLFQNL